MEAHIRELEKQRFNYLINKQFDDFSALCHQDLRYVHSGGTVDDLPSYLAKLRSGYYYYQALNYDIANVIDMQAYVVVTGDLYAKLLFDGKPRTLQNRALSIWKKEGERLKFFMYQGTPFNT